MFMIKVAYIDTDIGWQSIVFETLTDKYLLSIPEILPRNISDIWEEVCDNQIALVAFCLNGNGKVSYTGDDVAREILKHNKHFPIIIITSYVDDAIRECSEVKNIWEKDLITDPEKRHRLCLLIDSVVSIYDRKKSDCETRIRACQEKLKNGEKLSPLEEKDRFEAELYLSELDLDASIRSELIATRTADALEEMLRLAREIVD